MRVSFVKFGFLFLYIASISYAQDEPEAEGSQDEDGTIRKHFPGTSWCIGRRGDNETSSTFTKVDACCKTHSKCPEKIHPEQEKYGVQNVMGYTMRDCKCDDAFKKCLVDILVNGKDKQEKSASFSVVKYYFRILKISCLKVPAETNNKGEFGINPQASEKEQAMKEKISAKKIRRQGRARDGPTVDLFWKQCYEGDQLACDQMPDYI